MTRNGTPARQAAARIAVAAGPASLVLAAVALAAALPACGSRPAPGNQGAPRHGLDHAALAAPAGAVSRHPPRQPSAVFQTTRTFELGAGRATRTFTFREPTGVILLYQLTVRHQVRVVVDARIPHLPRAPAC